MAWPAGNEKTLPTPSMRAAANEAAMNLAPPNWAVEELPVAGVYRQGSASTRIAWTMRRAFGVSENSHSMPLAEKKRLVV